MSGTNNNTLLSKDSEFDLSYSFIARSLGMNVNTYKKTMFSKPQKPQTGVTVCQSDYNCCDLTVTLGYQYKIKNNIINVYETHNLKKSRSDTNNKEHDPDCDKYTGTRHYEESPSSDGSDSDEDMDSSDEEETGGIIVCEHNVLTSHFFDNEFVFMYPLSDSPEYGDEDEEHAYPY